MKINMPLKGRVGAIMRTIEKQDEARGSHLLRILCEMPAGSMYTTLERLEERGWLSSRVEKIPGEYNAPSRFYRLTEMGRSVMELDRIYIKAQQNIEVKGRPE